MAKNPAAPDPRELNNLAIAVTPGVGSGTVTARMAGGLVDLNLPVSPVQVAKRTALQSMAKAINVALQNTFMETGLEPAYKAARVYKGNVEILHRDYIGLGDGFFASIGRFAKSSQLTLHGPDAASPEGARRIEDGHGGTLKGIASLMGRKLNLLQEYEDKVPAYVEQMLDRLESVRIIRGWNRDEWEIATTVIGLDVIMKPLVDEDGNLIKATVKRRKSAVPDRRASSKRR